MDINEMKAARFKFLQRLYELTDGDETKPVLIYDIGAEFGFERTVTWRIAQYLRSEELIVYESMGPHVTITHYGVLQIEKALSEPEQETQYFPASNIISIGQMVGSTIQQASSGTSQAVEAMPLKEMPGKSAEGEANVPDARDAAHPKRQDKATFFIRCKYVLRNTQRKK